MISFSTLFAMQRYIDTNGDVNLDENLVAHYLLNNNAHDSHGTYDGTSTDVDFQGDSAYFDGVSTTEIDSLGVPITILDGYCFSIWITKDSSGITVPLDFNSGQNYILLITDTDIVHKSSSETDATSRASSATHGLGSTFTDKHHHIVINRTALGNNCDFWIDGVQVTTTYNNTMFDADFIFDMIGDRQNNDFPHSGNISNIRVYNAFKTSSEIAELYAEGYYPKSLTEPTTTGLIAHYPLTGTAEDVFGTYDGTEAGGITYVDDSEFGSVSTFDAVSGTEITFPSIITGLQFISFDLMIHANRHQAITSVGSGASVSIIYWANIGIQIYIANQSGTLITTFLPTLNTWYHLSLRYTGTSWELYIDGVLDNSDSGGDSTVSLSGLGDYDTEPIRTFGGKFRNVRLYSSPLTAQEITDIYEYEKNFRSIDIDDGLIAYYPLKNNSLDNYYNEYDGTDTAMTYDSESAVFNGTSSFVDIVSTNTSGDVAWSVWVKSDVAPASSEYIAGQWQTGDLNRAILYSTTGIIAFSRASGGVYKSISLTMSDSEQTTWNHIVFQQSGTVIETYMNGVFEDSLDMLSTYTFSTQLTLGQHPSQNSTNFFDGNIKNVRIYNKALTPEQIEIIYNEESPLIEPVFDQALLYNNTNIATEFIV